MIDNNEFKRKCPYCDGICECETTHNGVGEQQTQPYICNDCGSVQIGPYDKYEDLTPEEKKFGFLMGPDILQNRGLLDSIKQSREDKKIKLIKERIYKNGRFGKICNFGE